MRRTRPLLLVWFLFTAAAPAQNTHQSIQSETGLGPGEHVVFFRSYGYPLPHGRQWNFEITGRIWKGNSLVIGTARSSWIRTILAKAGIFFVKDVKGQHLNIQLGGLADTGGTLGGARLIGKPRSVTISSDEHGEFLGHIQVSNEDVFRLSERNGKPDWRVTYGLVGSRDQDSRGRIYLCRDSGISVVSDIDDTIKDTHVWSQTATVFRTLFPFKAVAGMSDLFSDWSLHSGACFHYVGSGPDQMEEPIQRFLDFSGFPEGSVDLRVVSLKDRKTTRDWVKGNPCHYKIVRITKILDDFPNRRFCLIGDAGEGDKRALLWLAKQYPDRVKWVFIRHLPRNIKEDFVDPERYADDCRCLNPNPPVPRSVSYQEFYSPTELVGLLPMSAAQGV